MKLTETLLPALVAWLALMLAAPAVRADDLQLPQLMQMLARNAPAGKVSFVEKKYIGLLDQPVESSGWIAIRPPDMLEKRTLKPRPETMILKADTLTFDRPGASRVTINLQEHPEVWALIGSIRSTLTGNFNALQSSYRLRLIGQPGHWQLTLWPKPSRLSSVIRYLLISGSHGEVRTIEIQQTDGDHSEMTVTPISNGR